MLEDGESTLILLLLVVPRVVRIEVRYIDQFQIGMGKA
jgi:hypothetical protein